MRGEDGTMQIGLMANDGSNLRQLTRSGDWSTRAVFSPDGRYLACVRGQRPWFIVVVSVETDEETIVAEDADGSRLI